MQITDIEQLKQVNFGTILYLINPYGWPCYEQDLVEIEEFKVGCLSLEDLSPKKDGSYLAWFFTSGEGFNKNYESLRDLLSGDKYVFTTEEEALEALGRVRSGIYSIIVKNHHTQTEKNFSSMMRQALGLYNPIKKK